jgi:hypothetical protein
MFQVVNFPVKVSRINGNVLFAEVLLKQENFCIKGGNALADLLGGFGFYVSPLEAMASAISLEMPVVKMQIFRTPRG